MLRHENILEFKSGDCELQEIVLCEYHHEKNSTSNLLIREDRREVECPLLRTSTFSYDTGTATNGHDFNI